MTGIWITIALIYAAGLWIWNHIYYAMRHGVPYPIGQLSISALPISLAWPVTVFTHRQPSLCHHRDHVVRRGAERERFQAEETAYRRTLEGEQGSA